MNYEKRRLVIIGNGFDIYHGIKSKYSDFKKHLEINNEELIEKLTKYYDTSDNSKLWSQFEAELGAFDMEVLVDEEFGEHLPNYGEGFRERDFNELAISLGTILDTLIEELQSAFNQWIVCVEQPLVAKKIPFYDSDLFLTFNYTDTLERIYRIKSDRIVYIHNKAGAKVNNLIFGHSTNPGRWVRKQKMKWLSGDYDFSIELAYNVISDFYSSIYKDTSKVIGDNKAFFDSLVEIEEIFIIGHSLSTVDRPYFMNITSSCKKKIKWTATFYDEKEKEHHRNFLISIGVETDKIEIIQLSSSMERYVQLSLFK